MVRRFKDNRIQEMSSKQYDEMSNNESFKNQYELIGDVKTGSGLPEAPVVEAPIEAEIVVPVQEQFEKAKESLEKADKKKKELGKFDCACGFKAKSKAGLAKHQKSHE